jgi:hypothetical protein
MDFALLGVNLAIIAGIIGLTEVVKLFLPPTFTKFVILVPTVLGAVAAVALGWGQGWGEIVVKAIIYVGAATYIFKFGKTVVGA